MPSSGMAAVVCGVVVMAAEAYMPATSPALLPSMAMRTCTALLLSSNERPTDVTRPVRTGV